MDYHQQVYEMVRRFMHESHFSVHVIFLLLFSLCCFFFACIFNVVFFSIIMHLYKLL